MAKVLIYEKNVCPYCVAAKRLLAQKGIDFETISIDGKPDEYEALKKRTGMMTVPQIFINDKLVGGYTDLAALDEQGELDKLLNS
jgi:glutaredoxin 3